jgi:glutamate-ammonia-ligase adenylyltransferase
MNSLASITLWIDDYAEFVRPLIKKTWAAVCDHYISKDGSGWTDTQCPWPESFVRDLFTLWSRSDYAAESCARFPQWLSNGSEASMLFSTAFSVDHHAQQLRDDCEQISEEAELMQALRRFRRAQMLRILWCDLLGKVELDQTLTEVTALADNCIQIALDWLTRSATKRYGVPRSKTGEQQDMIVLGMGKLGARELNVSSDIDLIFAYPKTGMTDHPNKPVENHLFFTRLAQRLINVLDQVNGDGFVFRVDMRLRPYGSSGSLALNFAAFEDYYQHQGREWERFAMIKTRAITGDPKQGAKLLDIIKPFVYKKYADFTSFQALRDMKRLIMSEVHRKGGDQNIKLGQGGDS